MRLRKKQARYIPGLKYYAINNHKTRGYKGKNRYNFKNNYSNKKSKLSIMLISIGVILMIIGIMRVFQNTIVYSPMRFFGTTKGGVSFATSTILLFIGIVLMVLKKINLLGPILIFLGIKFSIIK